MPLDKNKAQEVISKHQRHSRDTGSCAVQVALLSERIKGLSEHLKNHRKDHHSRLGLLKQVGRRKRHLNYLRKSDPGEYQKLIKLLDLRK